MNETVFLITKKGFGIEVSMSQSTLEQLKGLFAEGDSIVEIEE